MRTRRSSRARLGVALLEAIVAIAIFTTAGIAALAMASESIRAVAAARESDAALREASALLDAVALWTRNDLDQRLGSRPQGPWMLFVERPSQELYVITLSDTVHHAPLLQTSLFRPDAARGVE